MSIARKRNHRSARGAGATFERTIADYLALHIDDRIDRRVKGGAKDRGDIGGLRHLTQRVVIECKNSAQIALSTWALEAEIERGNDDALVGLVIHKRHGRGAPSEQWVTLTVGELVSLLNGNRDHYENREGRDDL